MDKHEFLKKIDSLKDCTVETRVLELYEAAEDIFDDHDDEVRNLKSEIDQLGNDKEELKDEVHDYVNQIEQLESESKFHAEGIHDNIRTVAALESIFANLDFIPVYKLESFINQYKKY